MCTSYALGCIPSEYQRYSAASRKKVHSAPTKGRHSLPERLQAQFHWVGALACDTLRSALLWDRDNKQVPWILLAPTPYAGAYGNRKLAYSKPTMRGKKAKRLQNEPQSLVLIEVKSASKFSMLARTR